MRFTSKNIDDIRMAAENITFNQAAVTVEKFYQATLGLSSYQIANYFPKPDTDGDAAIAIGQLTQLREHILREKVEVPSFVVYKSSADYFISGLSYYYKSIGSQYSTFASRLQCAAQIRSYLLGITKGHELEAISAALLGEICEIGEATQGSGDQGIDAVGINSLIPIDPVFLDGDSNEARIRPGQKVIILASSKACLGAATSGEVTSINPAHIREIIGGWMIQRSEASMWRHLGIQMLSPVQLLLVTTYRLSADSKSLCNQLGVQVWGIPELTFLLCKHAPVQIFPSNTSFSTVEFEKWWKPKEGTRIFPQAA